MTFGIAMLTIGALGIVASTAFEVKAKAKIYEIMMKVFALIWCIGCLYY